MQLFADIEKTFLRWLNPCTLREDLRGTGSRNVVSHLLRRTAPAWRKMLLPLTFCDITCFSINKLQRLICRMS